MDEPIRELERKIEFPKPPSRILVRASALVSRADHDRALTEHGREAVGQRLAEAVEACLTAMASESRLEIRVPFNEPLRNIRNPPRALELSYRASRYLEELEKALDHSRLSRAKRSRRS